MSPLKDTSLAKRGERNCPSSEARLQQQDLKPAPPDGKSNALTNSGVTVSIKIKHTKRSICQVVGYWEKCYWIQCSYWSEWTFTHFGSWFWNDSRRSGFSTRSLGHLMFSFARELLHQWTVTGIPAAPTPPPHSTTSSCFLSSSREGKHHVTKTSSWEADTSWIVSKTRSKVSEFT